MGAGVGIAGGERRSGVVLIDLRRGPGLTGSDVTLFEIIEREPRE